MRGWQPGRVLPRFLATGAARPARLGAQPASVYLARCLTCITSSQICSSLKSLCGGMEAPDEPKRMIQNSCPSGTSLMVSAKAKMRGRGSNCADSGIHAAGSYDEVTTRRKKATEAVAGDPVLSVGSDLGRRLEITSYDAAYVELAARRRLPLATLDARLRKACAALKVEVLP